MGGVEFIEENGGGLGEAGQSNLDWYAFLAQKKAAARDAVDAFVSALAGIEPIGMASHLQALDVADGLRCAMRKVSRLATPHPSVQAEALAAWVRNGDGWRDSVNDDVLLMNALRVLLPTYTGQAVTLYRGDSAANRRRRSYGMSWSSNLDVARSFAMGMWRTCQGGSVVLRAELAPEAILCAVHLHENDAYGEAEYLVDRRCLGRVEVLERFEQCSMTAIMEKSATA